MRIHLKDRTREAICLILSRITWALFLGMVVAVVTNVWRLAAIPALFVILVQDRVELLWDWYKQRSRKA